MDLWVFPNLGYYEIMPEQISLDKFLAAPVHADLWRADLLLNDIAVCSALTDNAVFQHGDPAPTAPHWELSVCLI